MTDTLTPPKLDWPLADVQVEIISDDGYPLPPVTMPNGDGQVATRTVRVPRMLAGDGRQVVGLTGGQYLQVPNRDAELIPDGALLALGPVAVRVLGRRGADRDAAGVPIAQVGGSDMSTKTLLRIQAPARLREREADSYLPH